MRLTWILLVAMLSSHCLAVTKIDICKPEGAYPPFYTEDNTGLIDQSILRAFSQSGYLVALHAVPYPRCLDGVRRGIYAGASATLATALEMSYMRFPMRDGVVDSDRALLNFDLVSVVVRGSGIAWDGQRFSGVKQHTALVLAGWVTVAGLLRERGLNVNESPKSVEQQLFMLTRGRAELAIGERKVFQARLTELGLDQELELLPLPLMRLQAYTSINHNFYNKHTQVVERAWEQQRAYRLRSE